MSEIPLVTDKPVLVTGASGFIALHVIKILLEKGYSVRGTVRSTKDAKKLEPMTSLPGAAERLELVEADLNNGDSFIAAAVGVEYIMHIASPFVLTVKNPQTDLVDPAVNGTLAVFKAAKLAGTVKRIILTSSCASICDSFNPNKIYTEEDWNEASSLTRNPYYYSKTMAERSAWNYIKTESPPFDLVVINPFIVLGPSLTKGQLNESVSLLKGLLDGDQKSGAANLYWGFVDVRDVAAAHVASMETASAHGRYICYHSTLPFLGTTAIIANRLPEYASRLPTRMMPDWLVRMGSWFMNKGMRDYLATNLGLEPKLSNEKIRRELNFTFRPIEDTIADTCHWLIEDGQIKPLKTKK